MGWGGMKKGKLLALAQAEFNVFLTVLMHRLGVVAQRLLREPLRETAFQRPLRPRISIAVQRHPGNLAVDRTKIRFGRAV